MAYATQADLVPLRISQEDLAELTSDDDAVDAAVVNGALDDASATVDAYCSQRYKTPLQQSGLVTKITADLALYDIASRRRDTKPTETWTQNRDMALSFLRDVASGKASLDQPAGAAQAQSSSAEATVTTKPQVFDDCNLKGFC